MITAALLLLQAAMPGSTIGTRVESLLARSSVPREGEVAVITTPSADTVFVGDQVEILTTAWFPATVRERLRRPPTLRPPALQGVWGLPVVTLPGVAAHRTVGESAYDLFASHQVVFPVSAGRLVIPAAELAFAGPGPRQFFGDERREERRSAERIIVVRALPATGRPDGFTGSIGRDLRVAWRVATPNARVGELLPVDILVSGEGNLSLWGEPRVEWPRGARVYSDRIDETPGWRGARLAGTRRFRFLLLPDSAGSLALPALQYPHFDPLQRAYRIATAPGMIVPILPSIAPAEPRSPPPLLPAAGPAWPRRVIDGTPGILLLAAVAAPALALAAGRIRRRRRQLQRPPSAQALTRFEATLVRLAGKAIDGDDSRIAGALRRRGVTREDAAAAASIYTRLQELRYGRPGSAADGEAILAEESARWLSRQPARVAGGWRAMVIVLLASGLPLAAQAPSPEGLYAEGAYDAAAVAQRTWVTLVPASATAWYNYGTMQWMARRDAAAAAAWLEAYRLAPRNRAVRRAWSELALTHQQVRGWAPRLPVTAEELLVAGFVLWLLAGALLGAGRWRRAIAGVAVAGGLLLLTGAALRAAWRRPVAITAATVPLREAPHGLARTSATVDRLTLVQVEATDGGWVLAREGSGRAGWLPAGAVVRLRRLD